MSRIELTKKLIIEHCERYPALEIQDLLKFLHQSSLGCEHLVTDLAFVTKKIKEEAEYYVACKKEYIESLDGDFCRVYLDALKDGLSAETLGKLFYLSANVVEDGYLALEEKLEIVLKLIKINKICQ